MPEPRPTGGTPDVFAFYLPQFYPIHLNDTWWGEGFTEWNTVLEAQRSSRAPRNARLTPGKLGFYDLRLPETRAAQGDLAREAGLAAFAVYHYWSAGDRVMPEVVDRMLADGLPDFPFFHCWANHDWTRAWAGDPTHVTWRQRYDELENDHHIGWLLRTFEDPRYYRVGSAPVLSVFNVEAIPDAQKVFTRWRRLAEQEGHSGLVVLGMARGTKSAAEEYGLDGWIQSFGASVRTIPAWRRGLSTATSPMGALQLLRHGDYRLDRRLLDRRLQAARLTTDAGRVPLVVTGWNNVGRRSSKAWSMRPDPEAFGEDLAHAVRHAATVTSPDGERRLVGINAWNEWGEGMTLEPSVELGDEMLTQVARVLNGSATDHTGVASTTNPR